MTRPLFIGSYLHLTWRALGQSKGRKYVSNDKTICTTPWKIQPMRIQESRIFESVRPSHSALRVSRIECVGFCIVCGYNLRSFVVSYAISHESVYFLGIHTSLQASVYTKKLQVTRGIFHGITLKNVA